MRESPAILLAIAFVFISFAMLFTALVYPQGGGLFIVTLATMPSIPLFLDALHNKEKDYEKKGDRIKDGKISLLGRIMAYKKRLMAYQELVGVFGIFFIGVALSVAFWATYLPEDMGNQLFAYQMNEIANISGLTTGDISRFETIFNNNFMVMMLMLFLSIVYSIGAVFLLIWNASILGVFLSEFARSSLSNLTYMGIFAFPMALFVGISTGLIRILLHGTFEFFSFFIASIAGGIFSVAVERKIFKTPEFGTVFKDVLVLFAIAVASLALAAYLETFYAITI